MNTNANSPWAHRKPPSPSEVWEVRVDSVLKLDRAAKREASDENQEEVPR